jgi:electron transport complex protein RnfG
MNDMIKLGLTLMIVTLIAGAGLALTNHYTAPQIKIQKESAINEALNKVIDADSFEEVEDYYEAYKESELVGKVSRIEAQGYSSTIIALVGLDKDNKITGVDVIEQQETPGLGANIEKESFISQFIGKTKDSLMIKKDGGEIDAITGATISSRAITKSIKDKIEEFYGDAITSASHSKHEGLEEADNLDNELEELDENIDELESEDKNIDELEDIDAVIEALPIE